MRCFQISFLSVLGVVLAACTSTPPLSSVTGAPRGDIFIRDVVQRIKCELSEPLIRKLDKPEYSWLSNWTAHIDLTLSVNDNAGISPTGSYTRFRENAVNFDAGPNSFPPTASRAVVNQFLTVSAGATLSGQAVRTEIISFTVALNELQLWRDAINRIESNPQHKDAERVCNFGPGTGVTGNLGLNEWVESAIFPAAIGQLRAGVHSSITAKASTPQIPQPGRSGASQAVKKTAGELSQQLDVWATFISGLQTTLATTVSAAELQKQITTSRATIETSIQAASGYKYVLEPYLKAKFAEVYGLMKRYVGEAAACSVMGAKLIADLKGAETAIDTLRAALIDSADDAYLSAIEAFKPPQQSGQRETAGVTYRKLRDLMDKLGAGIKDPNKPDVRDSLYRSALIQCDNVARALALLPSDLPKQIDPPIDSLLHSVSFVVSHGASVTPSWTLLQWKGPGQNPNFLSGSSVRTHSLVIAMGPPSGGPALGDDTRRLLFLQEIIRASGQQGVPLGGLTSIAP